MKKTNKKQAAAWVLSLLPLVMIAAVYRRLPAEVPMHWDLDGAVDYGAKAQLWVIAAMTGICIIEALRPGTVNVSGVVCLLVSLLMVYLGNVMPRFRMNWYCGFKTPWALSSETVWTRTQRVAGRLLFAAGLIGAAGSFAPGDTAKFVLLLAPLVLACGLSTVMSWRFYREESRK